MADAYHTAERLQLLARGYHILPNVDKMCVRPGWADPDYVLRELTDNAKRTAAQRIKRWPTVFPECKATGVRLENGLAVIDADVDNMLGADAVMGIVGAIAPLIDAQAPTRYGAGHKFALFCRVAEPFGRIVSHAWRASADNDDTHQVEIYGGKNTPKGKCSRQFGIYGPHSHDEAGNVLRTYDWDPDRPALHDIDLVDLPLLTETQALAIANGFDRWAEEAGWIRVAKVGANASNFLFDITDETRFDTMQRGSNLTYEELCEAYDGLGLGGELRCSTSFLSSERDARRPDHCKVSFCDRYQCVGVYVFGDEAWHLPIESAPPDPAKLTEALRQVVPVEMPDYDGPPPPPPDSVADDPDGTKLLGAQVAWLLGAYAYYAAEDTIVDLYEPSDACRLKPVAFLRLYRAWFVETEGKRGGVHRAYAAGGWEINKDRRNVRGVQMRPDQPFPLYQEHGHTYKNTYRRPQHNATGGNVAPFLAFIERLVPDTREREWLLDEMAHKQARPDIPGTCVIFVADNEDGVREGRFGTGRGLLFRIVHQLYGPQYARTQSFNVIDGTSSQSAYNDWIQGAVLVTVDESRTSPTGHRRGERNAVYDVLKDIVDPAPKRMDFKGKYRQAFNGMSYCTFWVATNHIDAIAIPEGDRRFTVLRNGRSITPAEAIEIDAWMRRTENIGALSAFLARRDLKGFSMFQPLDTDAKMTMADLARSEVEDVLIALMEDDSRGKVFTRQHLMIHVGHNFSDRSVKWHGEFDGAWNRYCVRLLRPEGGPRRVRVDGTQRKLFCFRARQAEVERLPEAAYAREAAKWGAVDGAETQLHGLMAGVGLIKKDE